MVMPQSSDIVGDDVALDQVVVGRPELVGQEDAPGVADRLVVDDLRVSHAEQMDALTTVTPAVGGAEDVRRIGVVVAEVVTGDIVIADGYMSQRPCRC